MVKSPTENSVPILKGAALIELKIGDLPIVFGGLISQASCLKGHSSHTDEPEDTEFLFQPEDTEFLLPACEHQVYVSKFRYPSISVWVSHSTVQLLLTCLPKNAN